MTAADLVTADNLGVLPPAVVAELTEPLDRGRPYPLYLHRSDVEFTMPSKRRRPLLPSPSDHPKKLDAALVLVRAYCEVLTERGYRYLDDSGRIANRYVDSYDDITIDLSGMRITKKTATMDEIRVSVAQVLISFSMPPTHTLVIDQAWREMSAICEIIGVTSASGFGFRVQFMHPVDEEADLADDPLVQAAVAHAVGEPLQLRIGKLKNWQSFTDWELSSGVMLKVEVGPAKRGEQAVHTLPAGGILFDFDARQRRSGLAVTDFRAFMRTSWEAMTDALPGLHSSIATEGNSGT